MRTLAASLVIVLLVAVEQNFYFEFFNNDDGRSRLNRWAIRRFFAASGAIGRAECKDIL
jgi:hypothetical protein